MVNSSDRISRKDARTQRTAPRLAWPRLSGRRRRSVTAQRMPVLNSFSRILADLIYTRRISTITTSPILAPLTAYSASFDAVACSHEGSLRTVDILLRPKPISCEFLHEANRAAHVSK